MSNGMKGDLKFLKVRTEEAISSANQINLNLRSGDQSKYVYQLQGHTGKAKIDLINHLN